MAQHYMDSGQKTFLETPRTHSQEEIPAFLGLFFQPLQQSYTLLETIVYLQLYSQMVAYLCVKMRAVQSFFMEASFRTLMCVSRLSATPIYSLQESWTSTGNQSHSHNPSPHLDSFSRQRHELSLRKDAKKLFDEHELPPHWSWDEADDGEVYYIDHEGETTWDDPRENFEDFFKFYVNSLNA